MNAAKEWMMQAVYIKADRDVEVDRTDIRIGDVIQIEGTDKRTREQICRLPLVTVHVPFHFTGDPENPYCISAA